MLALSLPVWAQSLPTVAPSQVRAVARRAHAGPVTPGPWAPTLTSPDWVDLFAAGPCSPSAAWPWATAYSPDGNFVYVALFGGYSPNGGCTVQKLDAVTLAPVSTLEVEESPEEIAFATDLAGNLSRIFVSNSSAHSVSVFDASETLIAHVPIPAAPGSWGAYPFGLAVSPDQSTVWVGTSDGRIHAIDAASATRDDARTLDFGPDHGFARMQFQGNQLIACTTQYLPGFSGSVAKLTRVDPAQPGQAQSVALASASGTGLFPSAQDLEIDGNRIVVAGFDMGNQVYVIDGLTFTVANTWNTGLQPAVGKYQAMGRVGRLLLVADYTSGGVARIDMQTGGLVGLFNTQATGVGAIEITPAPDGSSVLFSLVGGDRLLRYQVH
ncbi:MAG: YncE family protein [Planctomycetota bacterium]